MWIAEIVRKGYGSTTESKNLTSVLFLFNGFIIVQIYSDDDNIILTNIICVIYCVSSKFIQ